MVGRTFVSNLGHYNAAENSGRYRARPDTPRIFASSRTGSMNTLSGTATRMTNPGKYLKMGCSLSAAKARVVPRTKRPATETFNPAQCL